MAEVSRLAGALLAETQGRYFLVGNTKEPCDWAAAGWVAPPEPDAVVRPYIELQPAATAVNGVHRGLRLHVDLEGEALAQVLAQRLVIHRNGSVSERLWHLVTGTDPDAPQADGIVPARWLGEVPGDVWDIVRDSVLRCL